MHRPLLRCAAAAAAGVVMACTLAFHAAAAPAQPSMQASPVFSARQGDTLTVVLKLSDLSFCNSDSPAAGASGEAGSAHGVSLKVGYDASALTLTDAAWALQASAPTADASDGLALDTSTPGTVSAVWYDLDSPYSGGDLLTLTFRASKALSGTVFSLNDVELAAVNGASTRPLLARSASFALSGSALPGDCDRDGYLTAMDSLLLGKALVGDAVTLDRFAADCDGDGYLTAMDSLLLGKALVGDAVTMRPGTTLWPCQ